MLIQQHIHLSGFNRSWDEYKHGFGNTEGNYWIGNNVLSWLTKNGKYKLKFDLQQRNTGKWFYAEYSTFVVLPEAYNYKLRVAGYSGTAGHDSLHLSNGMMFSTYDRDNDQSRDPKYNCAATYGAGFWYKSCFNCGVNTSESAHYFRWTNLPGGWELLTSRMWLQCK